VDEFRALILGPLTDAENPVGAASKGEVGPLARPREGSQGSQEDLFELAEWKAQDPDVPDGDWYEDFEPSSSAARGSFRVPF